MLVTFGEHKGKSVASLVLMRPDYIAWVFKQSNPSGPLVPVKKEIERLIDIFDKKPFVQECCGPHCEKQAVRASAYAGSSSPLYYWCAGCDHYHFGAESGKLTSLTTYRDALHHVAFWCHGRAVDYKEIIRDIAIAKGLPKKPKVPQLKSFFA